MEDETTDERRIECSSDQWQLLTRAVLLLNGLVTEIRHQLHYDSLCAGLEAIFAKLLL